MLALAFLALGWILPGCADSPTTLPGGPSDSPVEIGAQFEANRTGTIRGQVLWQGPAPEIPMLMSSPKPISEPPREPKRPWPHPHAPRIDARTQGVAEVVIFLRGVEARQAKPWDHPPVRIEMRDYQMHIVQGEQSSRLGFVQQGASVDMVSGGPSIYTLRGRGAAFFSLPFPEVGKPLSRCLPKKGLVELSTGSGQFWMRGYLFVADHPYLARTSADGRFELSQVPEGTYELVVWVPNWHIRSAARDGETTQIVQITTAPAQEWTREVRVSTGQTQEIVQKIAREDFQP